MRPTLFFWYNQRMKTIPSCVALGVVLCVNVLLAGEASFQNCRARWTESELVLSNGHFSRTYHAAGVDLQTVSLTIAGEEWIEASRLAPTTGVFDVSAVVARRSCIGAEGLKITVDSGSKRRDLWLFPGVPGVLLDDAEVYEVPRKTGPADVLRLKPLNVKVTDFEVLAQTDGRNELLFAKEWMMSIYEAPLYRATSVMSIEDSQTGIGFVGLRLAPLPEDRPSALADFACAPYEWDATNTYWNCNWWATLKNGYPVAELVYTGGAVGRTKALHRLQRALRPYRAGRDGIFLSNTWGDGNRDSRITADFMMAEVKAGAELGVDVIQIDDGWQKGKTANSALIKNRQQGAWANFRAADPAFWKPDAKRFPEGLGPIVRAAKERGMGFGLWFGPDSTDHCAAWEKDAETLLAFYRDFGIRYFKIDSLKMESQLSLENQMKMFTRMLEASKGEMTFDLDVTGMAKRPGYFGLPEIGPLFLENRYTGKGRYFPHSTLRNVWSLAHVVDPVRIRAEFSNPEHARNYRGNPLSPACYRGDALFATVMCASPLGWFEISELSEKTVAELKPLVAAWKRERARMHGGLTLPIGAKPDGFAWTGFVTEAADGKGGYALLFRELNDAETFSIDLRPIVCGVASCEVLSDRGKATVEGGVLTVQIPDKLDYIWVKLH